MKRLSYALLAAIVASSFALPALAASCVTPAAANAMQVRQLHIKLQVSSLNCRGDDTSLPEKYKAYVNKFSGALSNNAKTLKTHFGKSGGNMDNYVTTLANEESQYAHTAEDYCASSLPLFEELAKLKPVELEKFAMTVPSAASAKPQVCAASAKKPVAKKG